MQSKMKSNYLLVLIACLLISCKVNNNSKLKNAHREEIENLYFSKVDFKKNKLTSDNYSNSFTLNNDQFLSIQFTLDTPLVNSLQLLAPNLTQDQVLNKGNFQFSFLVDEGMKNWSEMFNWMIACGFPVSLDQYAVMPHKVNRLSDKEVTCDINLVVFNNQTKPILKFKMFGCFPIALGDMPLNTADTGAQPPVCTGDIMYRNFTVETIT